MKIISEKKHSNGKLRMLIEVDDNETLITIHKNAMYKLGYPHEDIVPGHVIEDMQDATWCCVGQEWV